jgi:hypothetical protein
LAAAWSRFDLDQVATVYGNDHDLLFSPDGVQATLDNELDYGSAGFPESSPDEAIHTYIRLEFDLSSRELRAFVGPDAGAALKATVELPGTLSFNSFFVEGLNPTYLDEIAISLQ